jgi:hypothetical protein
MGDVSVLSQTYKTAADLSQALNMAVIALKKARFALPGADAVAPSVVEARRRWLVELLDALAALLDAADPRGLDEAMAATIPGALVARLQAERRGDLAYYLEDVRRVAARLRHGLAPLRPADFDLLDELAAAADAEASSVFRRLMRA